MQSITTFDSTKEALLDMLRSIRTGETQLPDFQRGWVWDDEHIRSLLASVSLSYPIGAVMMLETGNPQVRFHPRQIEGVELIKSVEPDRLILDGQQRLTSLYQALFLGRPVETKDSRGNSIRRWYYVDIAKALSPNRDEAIIGLPEDRVIRNFRGEVMSDYSSPEKEYAAGLFPLASVFDCSDWQSGHNEHWDYRKEKVKLFDSFEKEVVKRFEQYQIPLILLKKATPKEAVCQVFEKVNTGGVSLTVFELLTATYAADDFRLRVDWEDREKRLKKLRLLGGVSSDELLQSVTLLATRSRRIEAIASGLTSDNAPGISAKRKEILQLSLDDYKRWADPVTKGYERAAQFLHGQKLFAPRDLPYRTQLVPLAAVMAILQEKAEKDGVRSKLARWYWCGVFGELYGSAVESRFARDVAEVIAWVDGGPEPITVQEANFIPSRLLTLRSRNSAAYKGLHTLLLREGCLDFRTGVPIEEQMYFDDKIDIHHVFPQDWCRKAGVKPDRCDSVINKTPLSARTNRIVSGNAPSVYLARVQKSAEIEDWRMASILGSHHIDPASLHKDDFDSFFRLREAALLNLIEKAMGKPINRGTIVLDLLAASESVMDYQDEEEAA
jgi:hypothetical protein